MLVDDALLTREGDHWVASSDLSELPVPRRSTRFSPPVSKRLPADERAILTSRGGRGRGVPPQRRRASSAARSIRRSSAACMALVRRDLIRPEAATSPAREAYRFRHVLIRDAAYRSLPKNARADLHERFAAWLERTAEGRLREFEEIVGYHLEQAFQYRVALGTDRLARGLARRPRRPSGSRRPGGGRSSAATCPAAIGLLERVAGCSRPTIRGGSRCSSELGAALIERGRLAEAEACSTRRSGWLPPRTTTRRVACARPAAVPPASASGGRRAGGGGASGWSTVIPVFERYRGRPRPVPRTAARGVAYLNEARAEAAAAAWERAAAHARRAGDGMSERDPALDRVLALVRADAGRRGHPPLRGDARGGPREPESEAAILRQLACLHAIVGRFALARELIATSNATYADLGLTLTPPGPNTRPSSSCSPGTRLRPRGARARRIARSRRWASARSARRWPRPSAW